MTFNKILLGFRRFLARGGLFRACVSFCCLSLVSLSPRKERKKKRKKKRQKIFLVSLSRVFFTQERKEGTTQESLRRKE